MPEDCDGAEHPGSWLRQLRESEGLTQEELARRAGLATRTISNLESDRVRRPHPRSLRMVADALGLSEGAGSELQARFRLRNGEGTGRRPDAGESGRAPEVRPQPGLAVIAAIAVPRQLPPAVAPFVGRAIELARLDQWLRQARSDAAAAPVFAIGGMAGVGKTALALHWAHRVASEFPDGQLHVSLGGADRASQSADTADGLSGFLIALGVAPRLIPAALEDRSELYRRLVAGRRMLIAIDNAQDTAQVRALMPGAAGCAVVVTSRRQLTGLAVGDGARVLNLDVLDEPEALQLLAARLGADRLRDDPQAVRDLIGLCARLPLALVIAAARAAVSGWPLPVLVAELADARKRLDVLDLGDSVTDMRSVFSWSCERLNTDAARLLRLLAQHPGPDFAALAAASLAGMPADLAGAALRELTQASLLTEHQPGRYKLHDLLRLYAAEQARATCAEADLDAAVGRMLDHYLHTAVTAARLIDPTEDCPRPVAARPGVAVEAISTEKQALSWLAAEYKVLVAAARLAARTGFDDHARQLPHALANFFDRTCRWHDLAGAQRLALECAERLDDVAGQARAYRLLGRAGQRLGDTDLAVAHLNRAASLLDQVDDPTEAARTYLNLSAVYDLRGEIGRSLACGLRARDLAEAAGHQLLLASACNNIGYDYARLGELDQARDYCLRAIGLKRQANAPCLEASTWDSLGLVYLELGDPDEAIASYQRALELFRQMDARYAQADTLSHLGSAYLAIGEAARAAETWRQALVILDDLSHPHAAEVRLKLHGISVYPEFSTDLACP
jgi:tetratricopeptide (TPR) repeat protein/transcriptional regulator with XRE-family HTH domain